MNGFIHSFIHSGDLYSASSRDYYSEAQWDDSKLLHESNLAAKQPRRAPHHVLQATTSEGLAQGPNVKAFEVHIVLFMIFGFLKPRIGLSCVSFFKPKLIHSSKHNTKIQEQCNNVKHEEITLKNKK